MGTSVEEKSSFRALLTTAGGGVELAWKATPTGVVSITLFTVVTSLFGPISIWLTKTIVDRVASPGATTRALVPGLLAVGIVAALGRVGSVLLNHEAQNFQEALSQGATERFIAHAAKVDLATFENPTELDRMDRAAEGMNYRPGNLVVALVGILAAFVALVGTSSVLLALDPILLALAAISATPIFFVQRIVNGWIYAMRYDLSEDVRERWYYRNLIVEASAAKEVRAANLGGLAVDRYHALHSAQRKKQRAVYTKANWLGVGAGIVSGVLAASGYILVASRGAAGGFSPGAMAAVIAAMALASTTVSGLTGYMANIDQHARFLSDYFGFLAVKPQVVAPLRPTPLPASLHDGVEFDGVSFRYDGSAEPVLHDVSVRVQPGTMLALVGENGAGKTTMMKLLLRLYDTAEGAVRVGGVDTRDTDPAELRSRMGVLFQDYTNYQLTVREAVTLGRTEGPVDDDKVWCALERARATDVVKGMRSGLDSRLGRYFSEGHELSGGQWQRLALARLMYRDADIWILDEPTSALDPEAEAAIFGELRELLADRIGIVISHRFSTVRIADQIAVLDAGRVLEYGTHDELLAVNGRYAGLFELQAAGYR